MGKRVFAGLVGLFAAALTLRAHAEELQFVLVGVDAPHLAEDAKGIETGRGRIAATLDGARFVFTWTEPPERFGPEGFTIKLSAEGQIDAGSGRSSPALWTSLMAFEPLVTDPEWPEANIPALEEGGSGGETKDAFVKPIGPPEPGQTAEVKIGSSNGIFYTYRYQVGGTPGGQDGAPGLTASIADCPATIVISELPSVMCHLTISGFRKDTADPVEVVLPSAMDLAGNHGNGLQLTNTAGSLSVYNMTDPYQWTMTIFACPGQPGAGVNCAGSTTPPGPVSVPIIVRQKGMADATATLTMTAIAKPGVSVTGTGSGEAVTSTSVDAAPGQIGARIDCPGTIFISALPSLNCHVIVTGWLKDTAAPVRVLFPEAVDTFGNHANGLQLVGQGEEDHFSWDNDESHSWGFFVFACPGQSSTGANCYDNATAPGVQAALIVVEQDGLQPAMLTFMIDAQPHP